MGAGVAELAKELVEDGGVGRVVGLGEGAVGLAIEKVEELGGG